MAMASPEGPVLYQGVVRASPAFRLLKQMWNAWHVRAMECCCKLIVGKGVACTISQLLIQRWMPT
eukprot:c27200_g2_i1 orf=250-444(-)